MKITRYQIQQGIKHTQNYINKNKSLIYKVATNICRSNIIIDYKRNVLNNIEFIYDPKGDYWAETDGIKIIINTYNNFTPDVLYFTLLHETMHGMIKRINNHELSELTEHRIMYLINKRLIE